MDGLRHDSPPQSRALRTDPTLSTYLFFKDLAALVRQRYGLDITVDDTLEKRATPDQKSRCIDLVDFLFQT